MQLLLKEERAPSAPRPFWGLFFIWESQLESFPWGTGPLRPLQSRAFRIKGLSLFTVKTSSKGSPASRSNAGSSFVSEKGET